jgi:hypothetical protein
LICGSRYIVTTLASPKSCLKMDDARPLGDALGLDQARSELRKLGVVLDAPRSGAERGLRGRDRDTAVAGAQVEHAVVCRHLGDRQHGEDDSVERRHPGDVLSGASPRGRVSRRAVLARARRVGGGKRRRDQQ